jgi:hypothetical protein
VSGGGDITLRMPSDLLVDLELVIRITRGQDRDYEILSDLPVQSEEISDWERHDGQYVKFLKATSRTPGARRKVRIHSTNGNIRLIAG